MSRLLTLQHDLAQQSAITHTKTNQRVWLVVILIMSQIMTISITWKIWITDPDYIYALDTTLYITNNNDNPLSNMNEQKQLFLNVYKGINSNNYGNMTLTSNMTTWYTYLNDQQWLAPLKDSNHNISLCYIPKNSCTLFKTLFYSVTQNYTKGFNNSLTIHGKHTKQIPRFQDPFEYYNKLFNYSWRKWVILRDPLERYLSTYLFRCIVQKNCLGLKNKTIANDFKLFSKHFIAKWREIKHDTDSRKYKIKKKKKKLQLFDYHFLPQHKFCLLEYFIDYYDYIVYFDRQQLPNATLFVMKQLGIENYYNVYGPHGNDSLFQRNSGTTTHSGTKINEYFEKDIALELYESVFKYDYEILHLPTPQWFKQFQNMHNINK
eukprot:458441_1